MKKFGFAATVVSGLAAAIIGLAVPAAAAPTGPDNAQQTIGELKAQGCTVIVNRLGNALEKHESARRNFMADVSHELRTPLAVLKGELEALEDGVRPFTRDTVQSLQGEVATLSQLVADLQDLSLADVGGLAYRFEVIDLGRCAGETLRMFQERFAARNIRVASTLPGGTPSARARPVRSLRLSLTV